MKKSKKLLLFSLISLGIIAAGSAFGCSGTKVTSITASDEDDVFISGDKVVTVSCSAITANYSDGTASLIDMSTATITPSGDYVYGDYSVNGEYSFTLTYGELNYEFSYTVTDRTVTLNLNGGTIDESAEVALSVEDGYIDLKGLAEKVTTTEEGKVFAGWFYDKDGENRVQYAVDKKVDCSAVTEIYACYDNDISDYFTYEINEVAGTAALTGINVKNLYLSSDENGGVITIPVTAELYPITSVGDGFITWLDRDFLDDGSYTTLAFAEGSKVESIGEEAFNSFSNLSKITLPDTLTEIGTYAFYGCGITEISLPASVRTLGDYAFAASSLTKVETSDDSSLTAIGSYAFAYCRALSEIQLPASLTTISDYAFSECNSLTELYLPASVSNIELHAFGEQRSLKRIEVDSANKTYSAVDGNLYSKDGTVLVRFCFGSNEETFVIPKNVTEIYESAFSLSASDASMVKLKKIDFSQASVTKIGARAFAFCSADIELPASLTTIYSGAFDDWQGTEFKVSSYNSSFTAVDGVLYNKDKTELIRVPQCYDKTTAFVVPDTVKTIRTGAFLNVDTLRSVTVSAGSSLENIESGGLPIYTMQNLSAVYVNKAEPFSVSDGAFYATGSLSIYYGAVIVPEANYTAYSTAWADYKSGETLTYEWQEETYTLDRVLASPSIRCEDIAELVADSGYTTYAQYKNGIGLTFDKKYTSISVSMSNAFNMIVGVLPLLDEDDSYYTYFNTYANDAVVMLADLVAENAKVANEYIAELFVCWANAAGENVSSAADSVISEAQKFLVKCAEYSEKELAANVAVYDYEYSKDTFDADKFEGIYSNLTELGGSCYYANLEKWNIASAAYLIAKFNKIAESGFTADNFVEVYGLLYGNSDEYYYSGLTGAISDVELYMVDPAEVLPDYDTYLTNLAAFTAYTNDTFVPAFAKSLVEFDFSTYSDETYKGMIDKLESLSYSVRLAIYDGYINEDGEQVTCYDEVDAIYAAYYISLLKAGADENGDALTDETRYSLRISVEANSVSMILYDVNDDGKITYRDNPCNIVGMDWFKEEFADESKDEEVTLDSLREKLEAIDKADSTDGTLDGTFDTTNFDETAYKEIVDLATKADVYIGYIGYSDSNGEYYDYLGLYDSLCAYYKITAFAAKYGETIAAGDYAAAYAELFASYDVSSDTSADGLDTYYESWYGYTMPGYDTYVTYKEFFASLTVPEE